MEFPSQRVPSRDDGVDGDYPLQGDTHYEDPRGPLSI